MRRSDRLLEIIGHLRDGKLHRAQDIATTLGVSVRTIYRDMDTLVASGLPIQGERGVGYRAEDLLSLPPLTLTRDELEALNLGIAIVAESSDAELKGAAQSLADKVDAVLPVRSVADSDAWQFAVYPFADAARGFGHMPTLRAAIKTRQKLLIHYRATDGTCGERTIRPLLLEHWARIWTLTAWCETTGQFEVFRVDLIEQARALPALFVDEPGKRLADFADHRDP